MRSSTSSTGVLHTTEAGISRADDGTPGRRIRRGPNNEEFLPQIVPEEAATAPHKFGIPLSWILKVDSTPDRSMTLGNNSWLRQYRNWILAHAEILQLPAANDPRMRDNGDVHNVPGPARVNWNPADDYGSRCGTSRVDEESSLCDHHNTTVSDCGQDRGMWWTLEALKRDPDEFDMHIFGGFSSYGGLEVLENIFYQFSKTCCGTPDCIKVWCEVEGLAMYLKNYVGDFAATDDTERASDAVALLGILITAALGVLDGRGFLHPDSEIPNIGFILSILVERGWEMGTPYVPRTRCTSWVYRVLGIATEAGIELFGGKDFHDAMHAIRESSPPDCAAGLTGKSGANFAQRFRRYKQKHRRRLPGYIPFRGTSIPLGIGGTNFNITLWPYEQRRPFALECHSSFESDY